MQLLGSAGLRPDQSPILRYRRRRCRVGPDCLVLNRLTVTSILHIELEAVDVVVTATHVHPLIPQALRRIGEVRYHDGLVVLNVAAGRALVAR